MLSGTGCVKVNIVRVERLSVYCNLAVCGDNGIQFALPVSVHWVGCCRCRLAG